MGVVRWIVTAGLSFALGCEAKDSPEEDEAPATDLGSAGAAGAGAAAPPTAGAMALPAAGAGGAAGAPMAGSGMIGAAAGTGGEAGAGQAGLGGSGGTGGVGGAGGIGGAGGAAGATAAFQPCPQAGEPCKVLPLGDSITVGLGSSDAGGYRVPLFRKALEAGQSTTYVGTQSGGPSMVDGMPFPRSHEGFSGRTIDFIADRIPAPALDDGAHIILLMIGTNDMYMQPNGAPERLAVLLDEILEAEPDALLVVAQLTPFPGSAAEVMQYNAAIPPLVEERAAQGEHIVLVDMYTDFSESLLNDGVHPNPEGYALMADRWYAAIAEVLPQGP